MFQTDIVQKVKHIFYVQELFSKTRSVCEMWKNIVDPDRLHMTIRRMRIAYWITKVTNTHSEYVILIAFPLRGVFRPRQTRQLPRAVDLKGRLLSCQSY